MQNITPPPQRPENYLNEGVALYMAERAYFAAKERLCDNPSPENFFAEHVLWEAYRKLYGNA